MSQDYFKELAKKTQSSPSRALDQRILEHAARSLPPKPQSIHWLRWLVLGGVPTATAFIVWLQVSSVTLPKGMLAESPEMLRHVDDIELLVEAADWTEEEWRLMETGES